MINHHWLEAFHIIAVTAWMVGLFYLPRLYAYHANATIGSEVDQTFKIMERKLLNYIMTPAMIIAIILGLILAMTTGHIHSAWLHLKLLFVFVLLFIHIFLHYCRKSFEFGKNKHSATYYKILNESVTIFFSLIVILAVVKPF
jgi:putative membrane protein